MKINHHIARFVFAGVVLCGALSQDIEAASPSQRPETIQYKQERQWKTEELRRALKGKSMGGVVATLGKPTKQVGDDVWYYKPFTTTDSNTGKVFSYMGISFFSDGTVGKVEFFE